MTVEVIESEASLLLRVKSLVLDFPAVLPGILRQGMLNINCFTSELAVTTHWLR